MYGEIKPIVLMKRQSLVLLVHSIICALILLGGIVPMNPIILVNLVPNFICAGFITIACIRIMVVKDEKGLLTLKRFSMVVFIICSVWYTLTFVLWGVIISRVKDNTDNSSDNVGIMVCLLVFEVYFQVTTVTYASVLCIKLYRIVSSN